MTLHFFLQFRSLPVVGEPTNSVVPSDTLCAALGWAASEAGAYETYVSALLAGEMVVSSIFPRRGETCFYPVICGSSIEWKDGAGEKHKLELSSWRRRRAVLNRPTQESDVFWQESQYFRKEKVVLCDAHFMARVPQSLHDEFVLWVRLLGDAGIGGRRSLGAGGFDVVDVRVTPETESGGDLLLLSIAVPDNPEWMKKRSGYPWILREGYTDWRWRGAPDARKQGIVALPEGIKVEYPFTGSVFELDGQAAVYSGLAFFSRMG